MAASSRSTLTLKIAGDVTDLQKTLSELPADVQAKLGVVAKQVEDHSSTAAGAHDTHASAAHKVVGAVTKIGGAAAAVGGGVTAALGPLTAALGKSQDLTAQLGQALQNTGQATGDWQGKLDEATAAGRKLGITNEQTISSVQALVQAGVPYQQALDAQGKLADIATAKHEDLATATQQVIGALHGHAKALQDLDVNVKASSGSAKTLATDTTNVSKAQKALTNDTAAAELANQKVTLAQQKYTDAVKLHGASSVQAQQAEVALASAKDASSKATAKVQSDEATLAADRQKQASDQAAATSGQITLDGVLGQTDRKVHGEAAASADTVAGKMRVWRAEVGNVAESVGNKLLPVIQVVGPVMAGIGSAMSVAGGAIEGFKKVQELFTGSTEAATAATEAETVATDAAAASEGLALGPILLIVAGITALVAVVALIVTHFQTFKNVLGDVGNFIKNIWIGEFDAVKTLFTVTIPGWINDVVGVFTGLPGRLAGLGSGMWNFLKTGLADAINWIIDRLNTFIGNIPLQGHFGIPSIPKIPHVSFHTGGVVPGAPGSEVMALLQAGETVTAASRSRLHGGGSGGGHTFNIFTPPGMNSQQLVAEASWAMRTNGR